MRNNSIITPSSVMSKLLLQLVVSHKYDLYAIAHGKLNGFLLNHIADQLSMALPTMDVDILKPIEEIPNFVIDIQRRQCISDLLLDWLLDTTFKNAYDDTRFAIQKSDNNINNIKLLAICNFDAYSNGLNFVFGQAHVNGKVAAVYLPRLRQKSYGPEKKIDQLFFDRVIKEAVHELGHTFGLGHCQLHKCVMHFSNSISDTDAKESDFCKNCRSRIN